MIQSLESLHRAAQERETAFWRWLRLRTRRYCWLWTPPESWALPLRFSSATRVGSAPLPMTTGFP